MLSNEKALSATSSNLDLIRLLTNYLNPQKDNIIIERNITSAHGQKNCSESDLGTLVGHAFVQTKDATKAIRVTSSTSGYYLETLANRDGVFESTDSGIFAADLTLKGRIFTFTGKAQPQASANTIQFQLTKTGNLKQLPDGPVYKKVPQDDLDRLAQQNQ
ncbi:hypothetical protein FAM18113_02046 [Lacticaseibacillus paracasei]|nr:hypothetical protein FAM18113_02046 [Lacticaseibacillus paracasei]